MQSVLALDIGFAALGWAVVDPNKPPVVRAAGVLRTKPSAKRRGIRVADSDCERCAELARGISMLLAQWTISGVIVEVPHGGAKSARAARAMGLATGVVASVLAVKRVPVEWVTPAMVKRATTGELCASKEDVQAGVLHAFGAAPWSREPRCNREHIADACGAYLAASNGNLVLLAGKP